MKLPEDILIGGNHLASALLGFGCHPSDFSTYGQVLEVFGQPCADIWICWKAIMQHRDDD